MFRSRWDDTRDDFAVGEDGVLVPEGAADKHATLGQDGVGIHRPSAKPDATIKNPQGKAVIGVADIPACGPSPLTPAEIKAQVADAARRHEIDPGLAMAVAWAESDFDRQRNSPKGARGPMQLMPATARRLGVGDPCDPLSNIEGGVRHLAGLLEEFENPLLAAAAYNAGRNAVLRHGGIPPFQETVAYVAKVMNYQLGLAMPVSGRGSASAASAMEQQEDQGRETGIIVTNEIGTFVGSVMHF